MDYMKESIASLEILEHIKKENFTQRVCLFITGTLLYALSFTIFFEPFNIVTGGTTGLAQIINAIKPINISLFVLVASFIIQVLGFLLLGFKETVKTLLGVIILPIFLEFATVFTSYIDFSNTSLFLTVTCGSIIMGFASGIILKSGFSLGGFQTIYQIIYKYLRISVGKSSLILNGTLIFISGFFFGFSNVLYAIAGLYIGSYITDKEILGTSVCKTFYIVTTKEKEVNEFIISNLGHSATIIDGKGGYTGDKKKVLMCAIPTRQYFLMKEIVKEIDKNAFFLATDTYEINGGR